MNEVRQQCRDAPEAGSRTRIIEDVDNMRNLPLLKDYQAYLRVEKGLRPLTCEAYYGDLRTFAEFLENRNGVLSDGHAAGCCRHSSNICARTASIRVRRRAS